MLPVWVDSGPLTLVNTPDAGVATLKPETETVLPYSVLSVSGLRLPSVTKSRQRIQEFKLN
jgi:hypothetical protein